MFVIAANLYFYTILGGFYLLIAANNIRVGEYIPKSIGYAYGVPLILMILSIPFSLSSIRVSYSKVVRGIFPALLFCSWIFINSCVADMIGRGFNADMTTYFLFWSFAPFVCGVAISGALGKIYPRFQGIVLLGLVALGVSSAMSNWGDLLYARYRVSGYAHVAENSYAIMLGGYAFVWLVTVALQRRLTLIRWALILALAVPVGLITFFSGSMGGMISLCAAGVIFMIARSVHNARRLINFKTITLVLAIAVTAITALSVLTSYAYRNIGAFAIGVENISKYALRLEMLARGRLDELDVIRTYNRSLYIKQYLERPLLGAGFGNRAGLRDDPHNFIIELLGETGLASLVLYLLLLYYPLKSALLIFGRKNNDKVELMLAFMMVATFVGSFFSGSVFINPQLWFMMGVMPLTCLRDDPVPVGLSKPDCPESAGSVIG